MEVATFLIASLILIAFCAREFLFSYHSKKGENLATKEDVAEITREMEKVRASYLRDLERVRADLSSAIQRFGFRYGQEFEILKLLMRCLVELRDAALSLNPEVSFLPPDANLEQVKEERLQRFHEAHRDLYLAREVNRPFYADSIYKCIYDLEDKCFSGAVHYDVGPGQSTGLMDIGSYWATVQSNRDEIQRLANLAMDEIRQRVEAWEMRQDHDS